MTERDWAAQLLTRIAEAVSHGAWPRDVTVFDAARALRRAAKNAEYLSVEVSPLPDPAQDNDPPNRRTRIDDLALVEFCVGWNAANTEHGPIDRDEIGSFDAKAGMTPPPRPPFESHREDGSPDTDRGRGAATGRLWWRIGGQRWTDGLMSGTWRQVQLREGYLYPAQ